MSDDFGALEAGAAYALFRHGQDRQADRIVDGVSERFRTHDYLGEWRQRFGTAAKVINSADLNAPPARQWEDFIGQEPMKLQLRVHIASANRRGVALEHVLLASGMPGAGKTTMARLIAEVMGVHIMALVPPFHRDTLYDAARQLRNREVLFIDEIHKLADNGPAAAENLLHLLEERRLYLGTGVVDLADITVIGATTEPDKLPETIVDRFPIKPYFQPYEQEELARISVRFEKQYGIDLPVDLHVGMAKACRGTPRVLRELVMAARDMTLAYSKTPTLSELLAFKELEPDGMTRVHVAYLTNLYRYFQREKADGTIEYIAGEAAMQQILRETKPGIGRVERFLTERGLIDRTPRGRRLTERGILRAIKYIEQGKG